VARRFARREPAVEAIAAGAELLAAADAALYAAKRAGKNRTVARRRPHAA
jgi:PleD family two-component response regulator